MSRTNVNSYGNCLQNEQTHTMENMKGNFNLLALRRFNY